MIGPLVRPESHEDAADSERSEHLTEAHLEEFVEEFRRALPDLFERNDVLEGDVVSERDGKQAFRDWLCTARERLRRDYGHQELNSAYPALSDPAKQIRLLLIVQDDDENDIRCQMSVHDLDEVADEYVAVSYTWGDEKDQKQVLINGMSVPVRYNCWYAMRQMKTYGSPRPIWIDSLCIDQGSHGEKTMQVRQMGEIYSQAYEVAACLGGDGIDMSFYMRSTREAETILSAEDHEEAVAAYSFLLDRRYFERLWIVQECILAQHVELFIGRFHCPWSDLMDFYAGVLRTKGAEQPTAHGDSDYTWNIADPRQKHLSHRSERVEGLYQDSRDYVGLAEHRLPLNLPDLILRYRNQRCYDMRDKIFALLSLVSSHQQEKFKVDYGRRLVDLLVDTAAAYETLIVDPDWHWKSSVQYGSHNVQLTAQSDPSLDTAPQVASCGTVMSAVVALSESFSQSAEFLDDIADLCSTRRQPSASTLLNIRLAVEKPGRRWDVDLLTECAGSGRWPDTSSKSLTCHDDPGTCKDRLRSAMLNGKDQVASELLLVHNNEARESWAYMAPSAIRSGDEILHTRLSSEADAKQVILVLRWNDQAEIYTVAGIARYRGRVSMADTEALSKLGLRWKLGQSSLWKFGNAVVTLRPVDLVLMSLMLHSGLNLLDLTVESKETELNNGPSLLSMRGCSSYVRAETQALEKHRSQSPDMHNDDLNAADIDKGPRTDEDEHVSVIDSTYHGFESESLGPDQRSEGQSDGGSNNHDSDYKHIANSIAAYEDPDHSTPGHTRIDKAKASHPAQRNSDAPRWISSRQSSTEYNDWFPEKGQSTQLVRLPYVHQVNVRLREG